MKWRAPEEVTPPVKNWDEGLVNENKVGNEDVREVICRRAQQIVQEEDLPFGRAVDELERREPGLMRQLPSLPQQP